MKKRQQLSADGDRDYLDRPVARFQIELLADRLADIDDLMRQTGIRTKRELIDDALSVLQCIVEQVALGKDVGFLDPREPHTAFEALVYPRLRNVKSYEKYNNKQNGSPPTEAAPSKERK